jgi:hypothetical protein
MLSKSAAPTTTTTTTSCRTSSATDEADARRKLHAAALSVFHCARMARCRFEGELDTCMREERIAAKALAAAKHKEERVAVAVARLRSERNDTIETRRTAASMAAFFRRLQVKANATIDARERAEKVLADKREAILRMRELHDAARDAEVEALAKADAAAAPIIAIAEEYVINKRNPNAPKRTVNGRSVERDESKTGEVLLSLGKRRRDSAVQNNNNLVALVDACRDDADDDGEVCYSPHTPRGSPPPLSPRLSFLPEHDDNNNKRHCAARQSSPLEEGEIVDGDDN